MAKENNTPTVTQQRSRALLNKDFVEQLKQEFNSEIYPDREKGNLDDLTEKEVTISEFKTLESTDGEYQAVIFEEDTEHFYLSGGGLKKLLSQYGNDVIGLKIKLMPVVAVKSDRRKTYRPIQIIG